MHYELVENDQITLPDGKPNEGKQPTVLTRIRALIDLPHHNVKVGDLGGYIEKVENLQDSAWVGDNLIAFGNTIVYDDIKDYSINVEALISNDRLSQGWHDD